MMENSKRLKLTYSLSLFECKLLQNIGSFSEKHLTCNLIYHKTLINQSDSRLEGFLKLLYNNNILLILSEITMS